MDVYSSSSGLHRVVGYGPHSVVVAHHNPNLNITNDCSQVYSVSMPPPRPPPKVSTSYQLIPITSAVQSSVAIPVQQTKPQQNSVAIRDPFLLEQYRPSRGASAFIPKYNSIDDPHMQDFYAKKFNRRAKSASRRSTRSDKLYKITIKTANVKDAGTNARVFLSVNGSKDRICRKALSRETMLRGQNLVSLSLNGLDKVHDDGLYNIEFRRGATDIVYIRCRDLGVIRSIKLEHTGLLLEQSWLCEYILIEDVRGHRAWYFPCNRWLSLYPPGDGSLSIELWPGDRGAGTNSNKRRRPKDTEYEITVVTGDKRGAGTDSQVYITLFGDEGQRTEKIHLKTSSTNRNPFERAHTDKFRVAGDYVGDLVKLRIEHDNTGRMAGWYLERIVVVDLYDPQTKYFAFCNAWLSKDEGDGQISRDFILKNDLKGGRGSNKYKVTVYTGNKRGAGTDADVFITLYGVSGESGAIVLDNKKNSFEAGQKDEFTIECANVGEINKILIAHNNKGSAPGWFLDRLFVEDLNENRIYEFPCSKWLATDEGDGQISRFLFPKSLNGPDTVATADEGVPYVVTVYTGDKRNAGTDAQVYIVMHNKATSSGKLFLPDGKFERKSIDIITIDGPEDLSPLTEIDIGHDNSGLGPGWFLDKVVVDCPSTGIEQTFPCDKWLANDQDDKRIERRLKEDKSLRKVRPPTVPWYIWIYTSDIKGAGTDADVHLVLYGDQGKSHDIKLHSKSDAFEAGECDEFKVDVADVGTPYKVRVSHDNKKLFAPWHLDRIEMENLNTRKRYLFRCGRWLSKSDEDKQIIRELPAEGPGIKKPLPIIKYHVDVHTGKKRNAGTDANVFINIFGDIGDTGERPLEYSKNTNKFESGQIDNFVVEAVSLKHIRKIRIGHDNSGAGPGWFLEKVVVRPEDERYEPVTFECNRWFADDEDDGLIVRELSASSTQHLDKTTYNVKIKTGDIFQGGTDADVHLKMFGDKGDTDKVRLQSSDNTSNLFERGRTDHFTLEFDDIGKIEHIIIGHNGKNIGSGWFLDWVEIDIPMRGELYRFVCNRWLDVSEGDHKIELDLTPSDVIKKAVVIPYEITVFTGDKVNAGTDAQVFIQMYGDHGKKTEEIVLKNKSDTFERKSVDKFKMEAPDIGTIQKIRIGHNSEKFGSGWYLEKVLIQRHLSEKFDKRRRGFKSDRSLRLSQISATDPNVEEYWFVCQQWFDKSSGDKATIRELLPTDEQGNPLSDRNEITYEVHVFTGNKSGAGTDADVFLTIYGEMEDSGERALEHSKKNRNKFERNQEDVLT